MNRIFVIAEAGVNHNGNIAIAKRMIEAAKEAGADAVKFQTFQAEKLVTASARKVDYQIGMTGSHETQLEMLRRLQLAPADFDELFRYCRERDIIFMSTPFDEESADMLDMLGMEIFKIPSGEITNRPLIEHIAKKGKPILLSTGMSSMEEVERAVSWIKAVKKNLVSRSESFPHFFYSLPVLLHCVSSYPANFEDLNLRAIKTMKDACKLQVGFSDHSRGIEASVAAVAIGASVIEKHFTLDKGMEGPDHVASLDVKELKELIVAIRNIEVALGDGIKRPVASEMETRTLVRKSIVATRNIKAGEKIGLNGIGIKRPGTGISPEYRDRVACMVAAHPIAADSVIAWEDIKDA